MVLERMDFMMKSMLFKKLLRRQTYDYETFIKNSAVVEPEVCAVSKCSSMLFLKPYTVNYSVIILENRKQNEL